MELEEGEVVSPSPPPAAEAATGTTINLTEFYEKEVYFVYDSKKEEMVNTSGLNEILDDTIRSARQRKDMRNSEPLPDYLNKIKMISKDYRTKFIVPSNDKCDNKSDAGIQHFLLARSAATSNIRRITNFTELLFNYNNHFSLIDCDNSPLGNILFTAFDPSSKRVIVVDSTSFVPFNLGKVQLLLDNLIKLNSTNNYVFIIHPSCKDLCGSLSSDFDRISNTFEKEYPNLASLIPKPDKLSYDLPLAKKTRFDCGWSCWAVQTAADLRIREEALSIREIYAIADFAAIGAHEANYLGVRLLSSTDGLAKLEMNVNAPDHIIKLKSLIEPVKRHLLIYLKDGSRDMYSWDKIRYFIGSDKLERFYSLDNECAAASFKCIDDAVSHCTKLIEEPSLNVRSVEMLKCGEQSKIIRFTNIESAFFESLSVEITRVCKRIVSSVRNENGSEFGMILAKFGSVDKAVMTYLLFNDKLIGDTHLKLNFT